MQLCEQNLTETPGPRRGQAGSEMFLPSPSYSTSISDLHVLLFPVPIWDTKTCQNKHHPHCFFSVLVDIKQLHMFQYQSLARLQIGQQLRFSISNLYTMSTNRILTMIGRKDMPSICVSLTLYPAMSSIVGPKSTFAMSNCWEEDISNINMNDKLTVSISVRKRWYYRACLVGFDTRPSYQKRNPDVKLIQLPLIHRKWKLAWKKDTSTLNANL